MYIYVTSAKNCNHHEKNKMKRDLSPCVCACGTVPFHTYISVSFRVCICHVSGINEIIQNKTIKSANRNPWPIRDIQWSSPKRSFFCWPKRGGRIFEGRLSGEHCTRIRNAANIKFTTTTLTGPRPKLQQNCPHSLTCAGIRNLRKTTKTSMGHSLATPTDLKVNNIAINS